MCPCHEITKIIAYLYFIYKSSSSISFMGNSSIYTFILWDIYWIILFKLIIIIVNYRYALHLLNIMNILFGSIWKTFSLPSNYFKKINCGGKWLVMNVQSNFKLIQNWYTLYLNNWQHTYNFILFLILNNIFIYIP